MGPAGSLETPSLAALLPRVQREGTGPCSRHTVQERASLTPHSPTLGPLFSPPGDEVCAVAVILPKTLPLSSLFLGRPVQSDFCNAAPPNGQQLGGAYSRSLSFSALSKLHLLIVRGFPTP